MGEVMEGAIERLPDVHVRLSPEVHGLLKALAEREQRSLAWVARELLEGALRRRMARMRGPAA